jgi:rhodanese-related sulfurtransferase
MFKRMFLIIVIAALLGGINNFINPNQVPWVGKWPSADADSDSAWQSLSYEPGDPPTLGIAEAFDRFAAKTHRFIDAREPDEYKSGHIQGAISLPYDYFDDYKDSVLTTLSKDAKIVTYCSGTECEASLYLARLLVQEHGYKNVEIFFGGWAQWVKHELPIAGSYESQSGQ